MKANYLPCAFINTKEEPLRIGDWKGLHVVDQHDGKGNISLYGSREFSYRHPDAPDVATVQVYRREHLMTVKPGDKNFPAIYLLLQAQQAVEQIIELDRIQQLKKSEPNKP
jgi:hypothetical protein